MLGALIPLQHRGIAGSGKILDCNLLARSSEEVRAGGCHGERTLGKLHLIIVSDRSVLPIAQVAPVPDSNEADIIMVILKTLAVGADIGALRAVQQFPSSLKTMVRSPSASHFQPEMTLTPDSLAPSPGIPNVAAWAREGSSTTKPKSRRKKDISISS